MAKMKDGDEKRYDAKLVLTYCEADPSVGINGGFAVTGIEVEFANGNTEFLTLDSISITTFDADKKKYHYCFDDRATKQLEKIAEDASQSDEGGCGDCGTKEES
jgi:hypothetical protein